MDWPRIEAVVYGEESSPKDVMGPRVTPDGVLVQGFFPDASSVCVVSGNTVLEMEQEDEAGYYAALLPGNEIPDYRFRVTYAEKVEEYADPYAFPNLFTEEEEKQFLGGVFYDAYRRMGAHPVEISGKKGVHFTVWAPNAVRVSLVGDFNGWDGRRLPMHKMPASGIFEIFVPDLPVGTVYKYEIRTRRGECLLKADPYAFEAEAPGKDASVVCDLSGYTWKDADWMKNRKRFDERTEAAAIYETSLQDWADADSLVSFLKETGYTHVELKPVMEYLDDNSDGFSTTSYFAPTKRYGLPGDFQKLIDVLHRAGIGVICDWTPAQFPQNEAGLKFFDGTPLYEYPDEQYAYHPFWGTKLYNYRSPMVVDFLISNACYWAEVYHVDGLRFDDVDAMLYLDYGRQAGDFRTNIFGSNENLDAVEFLKHMNSILKKRFPGILLIAQEDGFWPQLTESVENDHTGFDYKWNNSFTTQLLNYLAIDPVMRKDHHDELTLSMLYAYSEHYVLTLGSRDASSLAALRDRVWGNEKDQKKAQIRAAYAYLYTHPGIKMTAPGEQLPDQVKAFLQDLNRMYVTHPALYKKDDNPDGFEWIQLMKYDENVITFLRKDERKEDTLLVVCNFSAVPYENYRTGVPFYGKYKEIFNSDSRVYGGGGYGNPRAKASKAAKCDERDYMLTIKLPPLSVLVFSCTPEKEPVLGAKVKAAAEKKVKKTETGTKAAKTSKAAKEIKDVKEAKISPKDAAKTTAKKALDTIKKAAGRKAK